MYMPMYEDVEILHDYHYCQMMLRVNTFLMHARSDEKLLVA
jgi:hypothetical protein